MFIYLIEMPGSARTHRKQLKYQREHPDEPKSESQ